MSLKNLPSGGFFTSVVANVIMISCIFVYQQYLVLTDVPEVMLYLQV